MDNLTPTARTTLDALRDGPGNVHELRERTGRSRSATDKALAELARANLIVKANDGGDPADGAPNRWQLTDATPVTDEAAEPGEVSTDDAPPEQAGQADGTAAGIGDVAPPAESDEAPSEAKPTTTAELETPEPAPQANDETNAAAAAASNQQAGTEQKDDGEGEQPAEQEQPKLCRGCQAQMPKICPCCWQKTPAYCGTCRKDMPQVRRGEPGEPQILSNGLPKLRPGELEQLVLKIMRNNPLPHHVGVTGWTGGRVAIYLPGRSNGAINNALDKLVKTGEAELIGDRPMRYQLKPTEQSDTEEPTDSDDTTTVAAAGASDTEQADTTDTAPENTTTD